MIFLITEQKSHRLVFQTREEAVKWIQNNKSKSMIFTIKEMPDIHIAVYSKHGEVIGFIATTVPNRS